MPQDASSECGDPVWRACHPFQMEAIRNNDSSVIGPTTEMTGNPHLGGQPALIFSRDRATAEHILKACPGNTLIELCLDNLTPEEWQLWKRTGDIHVHFDAVIREVRFLEEEGA